MSNYDVIEWLRGIPSDQSVSRHHSRSTLKRRRPLTPESTDDEEMAGGSKKKRHEDLDQTPKAKKLQTVGSESEYSLSTRSSVSRKSGSQSPQKQFNALGRLDRGIEIRELSLLRNLAPDLKDFLNTMRRVARGQGILPLSMRTLIGQSQEDSVTELDSDFYFSQDRDQLGSTPSLEDVNDILQAAAECQGNFHAEPGWNMLVHSEVLRLAFRPAGLPKFEHMVNFMPCSTAGLIDAYLPSSSVSKKVDFCIYIDPAHDDDNPPAESQSAVLNSRDQLPDGVINHTDYYPLRDRPIALSIETKRTGEGWDGATLQLSVWQAAHWRLLDLLNSDREDEPAPLPVFLPGVIIQGHGWYLVIATRENMKTVCWNKINIGSTDSVIGVYQIICGLQIIRRWARNSYWPAFRRIILPMPT
ncbi:Hypothetical protein NCS54_01510100 [Fusarium falciforme]|uniref:Hypothetical protein n=1 Tax=Fusarium falciforme TaxID=195108 RepID=UPI0022FFF7C9|nr:Hypothetical protein NCS54_01510100 [Fusarium falciforme]WAO97376.1 Hypothetical protein NCS54_01510100 [Fusarium falciforme]